MWTFFMDQQTSKRPMVLLIDLDNCPKEMGKVSQVVDDYTRIIVCYGGIEPKVPLGLVTSLATAIHDGKLELIGMDRGGKNAADFGLAFWAGRLVTELPEETAFTILSDDTDLDHVVDLLTRSGRHAKRLNGQQRKQKAYTKAGTGSDSTDVELGGAVKQYVEMRLLPGKPRPAKRSTLLNSIKAVFSPKDGVSPETILKRLQDDGYLEINSKGKVVYLLDNFGEEEEVIHF
ncbi:hypothetical protein Mmc1_2089 [Magnetococcus marinus MC-1]|uniref:PIN-like domain-containing protein n=2 Tax=Magnetococcus TaxID=162171 RepID=A0L9E7_MAGMM|nr:hypothetical protein Mmc1_2089 [Magnetococcus marinus MC-1]